MKLRRALGSVLLCTLLASALSGCSDTLDSLGKDPGRGTLGPVTRPTTDNAFVTISHKDPTEISDRISKAFYQLFADDGSPQTIYFPRFGADGSPQAAISDVWHGGVPRTEGMGLGMLIAVELGDKERFDRLWTFARQGQLQRSGAAQGYFNSYCGEGLQGDKGTPCLDTYGMEQFVLALMFAHGRWGSSAAMPYASDAVALLDVLQNKELLNNGVRELTDDSGNVVMDDSGNVQYISSAFDPTTHLVRERPTTAAAGYVPTAMEMPAAYELWAQATGNVFWKDAADAARTHLAAAADATTGLWPIRSYFDGSPVPDSSTFTQQVYRTQLNLALDALWGTATPDETRVPDLVLAFFSANMGTYGRTFTLDGTPIDADPTQALISVNGALAVATSSPADRKAFVDAVWAQTTPSGDNRYYDGLMYLMSLLVLSGQLRVW